MSLIQSLSSIGTLIKPNKILTPGHAVIDKRDRINLRLLKLRWFIEPSLFKPYSKIKREGAKR